MDYCLVYLSSSKGLFSPEELKSILHQSRENNAALGITGILLYCEGNIIQALEGPEEKVKALYEIISRDERHWHITKLLGRSIDHRSFGDWSMGYKTVSATELKNVEGLIKAPNQRPWDSTHEEGLVLGLIQLFYQTNLR